MSTPSRRARRAVTGIACAVVLVACAGSAGAQDPAAVGAAYEAVVAPAATLTMATGEAARLLQRRAVRSMRAARALLVSLDDPTRAAYPSCAASLARIDAGAARISRGASLVRSSARLRGPARHARVVTARARIRSGRMQVESGLSLAGVCRYELAAHVAPPMPTPGTGPGGTGPPIFDFL